MSFLNWFERALQHPHSTLVVSVLWWVWRWRNEAIFGSSSWPLNYVLRQVMMDTARWKQWPGLHCEPQVNSGNVLTATASNSQLTVVVSVDGSWVAGLDRMGCAAILHDACGAWVNGVSMSVSNGNSFLAEMLALELGLQHAWDAGYKQVTCRSDCLMLVEALHNNVDAGTFWDRDALDRLKSQLQRDWVITVEFVPREQNTVADFMAKQASHGGLPKRVWRLPPTAVIEFLCADLLAS